MDTVLLTPLNNIESSLNTLVHSLTSTNTFSAAPGAAKDLVSADEALVSALQTLKTHQEKYQRILQLRVEADSLNQRLRDIVRTCVSFRTEIGEIHPSILEDTEDEEEGQDDDNKILATESAGANAKEVDYETLLSFAARIGKHNALASRAVDEEATQRKVEARRKREQDKNTSKQQQQSSQQQQDLNGRSVSRGADADGDGANNTNTLTQESQANLVAIDNDLAAQRAYMGQAFPAADRLRMGALGQLQLLKERAGEEAVDQEIERMVKESELGIISAAANLPETTGISAVPAAAAAGLEATTAMRTDKAPADPAAGANTSSGAAERPPQQRQSVVQQQQPPPPPKKKVLDLDFPGSDDEDED